MYGVGGSIWVLLWGHWRWQSSPNMMVYCWSKSSSKQRYIYNAVTPLVKLLFCVWEWLRELTSHLSVSECLSVCLLCSVYVCFSVFYVWRMSVSRLLSGSCHCLKSCSVFTLEWIHCNLELGSKFDVQGTFQSNSPFHAWPRGRPTKG